MLNRIFATLRFLSPSTWVSLAGSLVSVSTLVFMLHRFPQPEEGAAPLPLRQLRRLEQVRRGDSAAAFKAGRLYQQRLNLDFLRRQDEAHDTLRPGPVQLPAFPR